MHIQLIQNLIRQTCHYDFETKNYIYFLDKQDTEEFDVIRNTFWLRNPQEKLSVDDMNCLIKVLSKRWERFQNDPIRRDSYLVIRAKIDRFYVEIAKVLADVYPQLMHDSPPKTYYDFLMPTLVNSRNYPTDEKFRKLLTISDDGRFLISLAEVRQRKEALSKSELFLLQRWEWIDEKELKRISSKFKVPASQITIDPKEVKQDSQLLNPIYTLLSNMVESGEKAENLSQRKKDQQSYFNQEVKKLNLEQLTVLSNFMNDVQIKKIDIMDSKFDSIRKEKAGYGNTETWREMRRCVKSLIVEALFAKYKNHADEAGKIHLPVDVYSKYAELLSQNTHHKHNFFKYPDTYNLFKKTFQADVEIGNKNQL